MKHVCTDKNCKSKQIHKHSSYYRKSDRRRICRYKCYECGKTFSSATFSKTYRQKKRQLNYPIYKLLTSGVGINQIAENLNTSPNTVLRKLVFLGEVMKEKNRKILERYMKLTNGCEYLQFDEMHSFVHTKCKQLSIASAVDRTNRIVLGLNVSKSPAKGKLSKIAREKYYPWPNEEREGLRKMFEAITSYLSTNILIESDQKDIYLPLVRRHFNDKNIKYHMMQYKGRQASVYGMGELKTGEMYRSKNIDINVDNPDRSELFESVLSNGEKQIIRHNKAFDNLFQINHTLALFRDKSKRLARQTWCTTKKIDNLKHQLELVIHRINSKNIKKLESSFR